MTYNHDNKIFKREFIPGQCVLLYNTKLSLFLRKLKSRWSGPFRIKSISPYRAMELFNNKSNDSFVVNGQRLKHYLEGDMYKTREVLYIFDPVEKMTNY